ncbi:uncharacterized protein LOC125674788 [Ostrea edulis]|uniref:uncharacterized protein LOC125674788 n=1 Tax=Ostrea edulis TaxID=37623 RepID=UPI0024AF541E|nr:uncharacterized protein LOC125674788 [Ostrea edulis]
MSSFEMDTSYQTGQKSKLSPGEEAIMQYLIKLDKKMDKLQDDLKSMREELAVNKTGTRREEQQKLYVPPKIRTAVHDAYKQLVDEDGAVRWQTKLEDNKLKASSEVNKATTQSIKQFVKGLYPEVQEGLLQTAIARYFESMAQREHKEKTGKVEQHKTKMLHYSRRKRKLQWRKSMVGKKTGWDEAKKRRVGDALVLSYMSSEDEHNTDDESFLKTKPLRWR